MVSPARRFEQLRRKYPAMNVDEALIWREWLKRHEAEWDQLPPAWLEWRATQLGSSQPQLGDVFDYNVRLGGKDPGASTPEPYRSMAIALSQLRLDAVGFRGGAPWIFEVKRTVGPPQVGQLVSYRAAWVTFAAPFPRPQLFLVGQTVTDNVRPIIAELGIAFEEVTVDLSVLSPHSRVTG